MTISDADLNWALMHGGERVLDTGDGLAWRAGGESGGETRALTQADIDGLRTEHSQSLSQQAQQFNSNPSFRQFTPEQVQAYLANPRDEQFAGQAIYGNPKTGEGGIWAGPQPGPQHNDNGFGWGDVLTGGIFAPYKEQSQTAWNDMRNGAAIMALPFVGAGITAAAGAGSVAGGVGSESLLGGAGADTLGGEAALGGETLFPGESATSGMAGNGAGGMPGDMSNLFSGEANPGASTTPQGGGSFMDFLSKGPGSSQGFGGLQPSDFMKTGLNLGIQQLLTQRQQSQAQQVQRAGNPLNDPQRAPFQQQATNMANNPGDYFANNPFASSLAAYFKNNVIPSQVAKSGNPGEVIDRTGSQFATALGGNYNQLLQTLMGGGGFNQGNSGIGASVPLMQGANNSFNESFRGLGGLASKSIDSVFGDPTRPNSNASGGVFGGSGVSA
jgi:hypothetical protein